MSASLMVFIPLAVLGLVTALCFVGCGLHTGGIDLLGPYQDKVFYDPNIVACWPLNDQAELPDNPDGTPAVDIIKTPAQFNGTYTGTAGTIKVQQPGIVPGDVPGGSSTASQCAFFNGGLVQVAFQQSLNPAKFTVEAWVLPNWNKNDPPALRAVLVSATSAGAGYALFAQSDNVWEAQIGTGNGNFFSLKATQPIELGVANYLALTFDGTTLTLFVGPVGGSLATTPGTPPTSFVPEDSTATPSTATPLFIGTGHPDATPGNPFNGFIQDVAIYKDALSASTIMDHFNTGRTAA